MQTYAVTIRLKSPRKLARWRKIRLQGARLSARTFLFLVVLTLAVQAAVASIVVQRQETGPTTRLGFDRQPVREDEPVLLEADNVEYDHVQSKVYATGKVEVTQGLTVLLADRISYDQKTGKVVASGNVSVLESTGHVYFAENVELVDTMRQGVLQNFRARLSDDSLFAASEAEQVDPSRIRMKNAVYSPCSVLCDNGETKTPLWQLRARDVLLDRKRQKVIYRHAQFELKGVPVLYTPYLSHAAPGADNKSGIMLPEYSHSDNLGSVLKTPFYIAIAPDKDLTVIPYFTGDEGALLAGEYRQMFDQGSMTWRGSITNPQDRDAGGNLSSGSALRWHIDSEGRFLPYENTEWGFALRRASDDTYLRKYDFSYETQLTSRAYVESNDFWNLGPRSSAVAEVLAFQGLTAQDITKQSPIALPHVDFFWQGDPGAYGGRKMIHANLLNITRQIGTESRRLSLTGGWTAPYITSGGHMFSLTTDLRADAYSVDIANSTVPNTDDFYGRLVPELMASWRYPLIRRFERSSLMLEPLVDLIASPIGGNSENIPNEDSQVPEFSDVNLFTHNRFPGLDRIETGPRANYGVRGQYDWGWGRALNFVFGQHYRVSNDRHFPLSNDLNSHFSDYVGRVGYSTKPFEIFYRFRLDKDTFSPKRSEWNAALNWQPLTITATYLKLDDDPILSSKEEFTGTMSLALTKHWTFSGITRRDLLQDQLTTAGVGLIYANECLTVSGTAQRDFTRDRDVKPDTAFYIRFGLKNLN